MCQKGKHRERDKEGRRNFPGERLNVKRASRAEVFTFDVRKIDGFWDVWMVNGVEKIFNRWRNMESDLKMIKNGRKMIKRWKNVENCFKNAKNPKILLKNWKNSLKNHKFHEKMQ